MIDLFLFPLLTAALAMLFSNRSLTKHEFPMGGPLTIVIGVTVFGGMFLLTLAYSVVKVILP